MLANANVFHGDYHPVEVYEGRKSRNVIPWPFEFIGEKTAAGVTYENNDDGSVYIHGTKEPRNSDYYLYGGWGVKNNAIWMEGDTVTISGSTADINLVVVLFSNGAVVQNIRSSGTYRTATLVAHDGIGIYYQVAGNATVDDVLWPLASMGGQHEYERPGLIASPLYLPTESTASGTTVEVDGTYNDRAEVSVAGRSEQASYTGKNLLDVPNHEYISLNATYKAFDVGKVVVTSGNSTGFAQVYANRKAIDEFDLVAGKTYTMQYKAEGYSGNPAMFFNFYDAAGATIGEYGLYIKSASNKSFTVPATANATTMIFRVDQNRAALNETVTFYDIQLELGSTATEYEPYVGGIPSPNPGYPQDIKSVTGPVVVESRGRNLLDLSAIHGKVISPTATIAVVGQKDYPTGTYRLTLHDPNGNYFAPASAALKRKDGSNIILGAMSVGVTVTNDQWHELDKVAVYGINGDTRVIGSAMFEEGPVAHPYEPHRSAVLSIDLQGHELRSMPNGTMDELVLTRSGKRWIEKRVDTKTVTALSSYMTLPSGIKAAFFNDLYEKTRTVRAGQILCDRCIYDPTRGVPWTMYENPGNVGFLGTAESTLQELKDKYIGATINFVLAEPKIIPLPDGDPLPTWWPTTVVTADGLDITVRVRIIDDVGEM